TATSVQMLVGGTVDATQTIGPTTLAAILRGVPLKIVMVFNDKPSYWLYAKKGIRTFADLKGRRISSSTPGSTNDRLLKIVLERNGIDWKRDLQIVYIGTSDVVIKALLSGSIDAAVLSHPGNLIAKDAGFTEVASFEKEIGALTGGVAVNESFLQKRRDTAVKFLRATLKGLKFFRTNREGSAKVMAKYMSLPIEAALKTHDASIPFYVSDGTISEDFQDKVLDFELKAIGADKRIGRDAVFDFSIMKALATKGSTLPRLTAASHQKCPIPSVFRKPLASISLSGPLSPISSGLRRFASGFLSPMYFRRNSIPFKLT